MTTGLLYFKFQSSQFSNVKLFGFLQSSLFFSEGTLLNVKSVSCDQIIFFRFNAFSRIFHQCLYAGRTIQDLKGNHPRHEWKPINFQQAAFSPVTGVQLKLTALRLSELKVSTPTTEPWMPPPPTDPIRCHLCLHCLYNYLYGKARH